MLSLDVGLHVVSPNLHLIGLTYLALQLVTPPGLHNIFDRWLGRLGLLDKEVDHSIYLLLRLYVGSSGLWRPLKLQSSSLGLANGDAIADI